MNWVSLKMQMNSQKREDVEKTILALLLSRKTECTLPELIKDYYEIEGEYIPWKDLGYLTLFNFLQSMPKTIQIEYRNNIPYIKGIASDKSKHVSKLLNGQRDKKYSVGRKLYKPNQYFPTVAPQRICISSEILTKIISLVNNCPNGISKDYLLHYLRSLMPFVNISMSDMEEQLNDFSHKIYQTHTKVFPIRNKSTNFDSESITMAVSGNEDTDNVCNCNEEDDFKFVPFSSYIPDSFDTNVKTKPTFSFIKESVLKCQNQIIENNCVSTAEHTLKEQTDQNNLYNLQNHNWDVKTQIHKEPNNNIEKGNSFNSKNVEMLINERVKFHLEKLIQNNPDGIWCADLPQKYLEEYGFSLNYTELGFNSVREFASHLPEIFHCVQPYDRGDFMLYFAKMEIPSNKLKEKHKVVDLAQLHHIYVTDDEDEALPTSLSLDACKKIIPDGIVTIGESVDQLDVTHLVNDEKPYIEIIVVEVFTPSFFWIQLRRKQKTFKLFMDELQCVQLNNFYTEKHQEYVMPPVVLERGLNCACMYNKIWHRGIIKTVKPNLHITVMFYDYGTLKTYPPEAIHYLHRRFSTLPAQAIPCGLINTRPYKGVKWTSSATHHFALRTSEIPLIATIASINTEDNSMMVTLTDTIEEEDVHINDWLVEQKLAQYGKMVCMKLRNFAFHYYLECQEYTKQKSRITETLKSIKSIECAKSTSSKNYSKNKVTLYNLSVDLESSFNASNAIPYQKVNKQLQLLRSHDCLKNDSSIKKTSTCTLNYKEKRSRNLKALYEKISNLQQISHSRNNNNKESNGNVENNESVSSSSISNRKCKQESHEESFNHTIESNYNELNISTSLSSLKDKRISKVSNEKYNILEKCTNIPKVYAHHFHIQDPDDENYIENYTNTCNGQYEFKYMDWSIIQNNVAHKKQYIPQQNVMEITHKSESKKRDNVPLAEGCFLNAVRNSVHFAVNDEDICWLPTGNINESKDASSLILRNIEKRAASRTTEKIIAIPEKLLDTLIEKKLFVENMESLKNMSENINKLQSISSTEENNGLTTDNSNCSTDCDIFCIKNSQRNSVDDASQVENNCLYIKPYIPNNKLLRILCTTQQTSSDTSVLDSDDLSVSEISIPYRKNVSNCNEKYKVNKYKNDVNIEQSILNESNSKTNVEGFLHSVETENINLNVMESSKYMTNRNKSHEKLVLRERSAETSILAEEPISIQPVLTPQLRKEPISIEKLKLIAGQKVIIEESSLLQKSILEEESVKKSGQVEDPLLIKETILAELVPVTELSVPDTISKTSSIQVFNDIDLKNDEEEWDAHVSYADMYDFLKIHCPFNKSIKNELLYEPDACLKIVEMKDSHPTENINILDNYQKQKSNTCEDVHLTDKIVHDIEHSSAESETLMD